MHYEIMEIFSNKLVFEGDQNNCIPYTKFFLHINGESKPNHSVWWKELSGSFRWTMAAIRYSSFLLLAVLFAGAAEING